MRVTNGLAGFAENELITVEHLQNHLRHELQDESIGIAAGRIAFEGALERAKMALAVSGTVTLELAFADVPHVLFYVADKKNRGAL